MEQRPFAEKDQSRSSQRQRPHPLQNCREHEELWHSIGTGYGENHERAEITKTFDSKIICIMRTPLVMKLVGMKIIPVYISTEKIQNI